MFVKNINVIMAPILSSGQWIFLVTHEVFRIFYIIIFILSDLQWTNALREASQLTALLKEMKEGLDTVTNKVQALTAKVSTFSIFRKKVRLSCMIQKEICAWNKLEITVNLWVLWKLLIERLTFLLLQFFFDVNMVS